ncbi:MAG: methane monooxygenase/ammonia monooxygenase subunit C [Pseudomonadota bacterium]
MSAVLPLSDKPQVAEVDEQTQDRILNAVPWKMLTWIMVSIVAVYSLSRVYLHQFAYTVGLDFFEPEFAQYWMPLFYIQASLSGAALLGASYYLWRTRTTDWSMVTPEVELIRYFRLIALLIGYTLLVLISGAIQGESDAAWHQVVIRDTDFTPTHIGLFYLCIPGLIIFGITSFLYAKTRLPMHSKQSLLALGVAIGGPVLIMPNVGFNEWGHTFFYAEEVFGAPIHWGFATLGLALLGLGGVVIHVAQRMMELIDEISEQETQASS